MLEEPQRQDSALHPLIEARRAVLQDLANNPVRASSSIPIPSANLGSNEDFHLSPASRADSARDTLTAARSAVRASVAGVGPSDSSAPGSGGALSHWPDQASSSSPRGLSGEPSSSHWGSVAPAAFGGLASENSSAAAYGPPMQDNPSQTLEEARRLLAASLHAEPSSSSSFSQAGSAVWLPLRIASADWFQVYEHCSFCSSCCSNMLIWLIPAYQQQCLTIELPLLLRYNMTMAYKAYLQFPSWVAAIHVSAF